MKLTPSLGGAYSGSFGGVTASHNKGGAYFRRRSVPTSPNTARQQAVKSIVGGLVQAWSDELSAVQRAAWRDYAANVPRQDTLGQTINLSGQNWYIGVNTPILQALNSGLTAAASLVRIDDAPTVFNTGEAVSTFELTEAAGVVAASGALAAPASEVGLAILFLGSPQNAGRRFFKGPYQLAAVGSAIAATNETFSIANSDQTDPLEWVTDKVIAEGDLVPVRVIIAYDDGRVSQEFREITTVVAPPV